VPEFILDCSSVPLPNPHAVLQHFGEHFVEVLGGGGTSPCHSGFLGHPGCEIESSLGAKGEVCDKPSLQEVAECIVVLHNVALPRASFLKVGLELATWLHKVILVV